MLMFVLVVFAIVVLAVYLQKTAPFFLLSSKLPGPFAFPIIGCAWKFINKNPEEVMEAVAEISSGYPSPLRFWLGPKFLVIIKDPENTRMILTSTRMNTKGDIYRFLGPLLGNGLITGSGFRWREHKKIIRPLLNGDLLNQTLELFRGFSQQFLEELENMVGEQEFDIEAIISKYVIDLFAIKILGYDTEARNGKNKEFLKAPKSFYEVLNHRTSKPWIQPTAIFKLTKFNQVQQKAIRVINEIVFKAIEAAKLRLHGNGVNDDSPVVDKILKAIEKNPEIMTDEELGYHLKTLFNAAEDTAVNFSSFFFVCLGMHLEHQKLIMEELDNSLDGEHLTKCIKEVLRLFPAGPILFRETVDHFQLGELILPPKCTVLINIWHLHRNPQQWEHPEDFYPAHFDSDAVQKRPPYSYIPFSAGPRTCLGRAFALPVLKLIITTVLNRFNVHTDGDLKSLKINCDVTVRAANGYNVSLKRRNQN